MRCTTEDAVCFTWCATRDMRDMRDLRDDDAAAALKPAAGSVATESGRCWNSSTRMPPSGAGAEGSPADANWRQPVASDASAAAG